MDVVICFSEARTCTSKKLNLSRHTKNEVSENQVVFVIRSTANMLKNHWSWAHFFFKVAKGKECLISPFHAAHRV